jgi:MFS family permease
MNETTPSRIKEDRIVEPLWGRDFISLVLSNLMAAIALNFVTTTLPEHVIRMGGSIADTGILAGAFMFSSLLFRPLTGSSLLGHKRRTILALGALITAVASLIYPFVTIFPLMIVIRMMQGSGSSYYGTANSTMIAEIAPKSRLTEAIGYAGIMNTVASSFAPALILYLVKIDERFLIGGLIITLLACIAFSYSVNYEKDPASLTRLDRTDEQKAEVKRIGKFDAFFEVSALRSGVVLIFSIVPIVSISTFLPLYGIERNMDQIGLFYTVLSIATIITRLSTGKLADKLGTAKLLIPSLAIAAVASLMLALAHEQWLILAAAALLGVGTCAIFPLLSAAMIRVTKSHRLGAAYATFFAVSDAGLAFGNIVLGYISDYTGFIGYFISSVICYVLAGVFYFTLMHKKLQVLEGL